MSKAPLLSKPLPGEVLLLYLSVSSTTISSVLIRKPEKAELPIFYVSKALHSAAPSVPALGIASASPCCLSSKAPPILPSARDHGSDQSAPSVGTSKAKNVWPIGQMGDRAGRI
ncbi:unnamed protein product [Prunus armeniaca]